MAINTLTKRLKWLLFPEYPKYFLTHSYWVPAEKRYHFESKETSFLGDEPENIDEKMIKEAFQKADFIDSNDVLEVSIYPYSPTLARGFEYFSALYGDKRIGRKNYEPVIKKNLPQTHLFATISLIERKADYKQGRPFDMKREISIERIGVNPKYQGRGLGQGLVEVTEAIAKRYFLEKIALTPPVTNRGFWEKMGFGEVSGCWGKVINF